jgi:hypothetical protein
LHAAPRLTHPSEFSADFRELQRSVADLEEAANAFFAARGTSLTG